MSSELLAIGISHKTAPVARRERLALTETSAAALERDLITDTAAAEAVAISTCNRTEVYVVSDDPFTAEGELLQMLARHAGMRPTELAGLVYSPRNCDAARQLFRVTSGLESMIVGEAEVQGQVRRAYDVALNEGTTGPMTNRLFQAALATGGRVRAETEIGAARVSVSTVAVQLAQEAVGPLAERDVLVIGAGETSELTAQALKDAGARTLFIANRHAGRARSLAERFGGEVVALEALPERLVEADVVVSSTSSPHPIVHLEALEHVMADRDGRPLCLIDIAVPRDVEAECRDLPGVAVYDMDDLEATIARNLEVREGERALADKIVEEEIRRFARWMGQSDVRPTVGALRAHGTAIVEQVLAENEGRWEGATKRDLVRVDAIARAVMQRLLHEPTIRLKSGDAHSHARVQLARELFGLDAGTEATVVERDEPGEVRELRRRS